MRGWLFFDFGVFGFVRFNAHSVVEEANGNFIEITPSRASQRYPFIRHEGKEEDFISLVVGWKVVMFDYSII